MCEKLGFGSRKRIYIINKIDANQRLSFETFAKRVDGI